MRYVTDQSSIFTKVDDCTPSWAICRPTTMSEQWQKNNLSRRLKKLDHYILTILQTPKEKPAVSWLFVWKLLFFGIDDFKIVIFSYYVYFTKFWRVS